MRLASTPRRLLVPAALLAAGLLMSGCTSVPTEIREADALECPPGSDCYDPPRPMGPGGELAVEAGEFYFEIRSGAETLEEGPVQVTLENVGSAEHDFTIDEAYENVSVPEGTAPPGETVEGTLELFPGEWTYYCSVPGHRQQGMVGTITVSQAGAVEVTPVGTPGEQPGGAEAGEGGPEPAETDEPADPEQDQPPAVPQETETVED